ncbi:hypothetical protein FCULG_00003591 [Fusarium culmorum]|uniref:Helicase C-terminal domain-containing protein n=1 Tax=Fusarium culmorum TaxID=5516 RepID=A0A2T4HAP3_FUSCU|nr:hypothetical protein FCULG_00003591 [Fusarium culmorum]
MNSLFQQDNEYDMHALWTQTSNFPSPAKMISKRSGKTSKKIPLMTTMMTGKDYMYNEDVLGDDDDEAESTPYQAPERQPKPGTFDPTQRAASRDIFTDRVKTIISIIENVQFETSQDKIIVVSCSVMFLDVINETMTRRRSTDEEFNYRAERYDGTASTDERRHIAQNFNRTSYGPTVLLLSAHTGGTGLNLTGPSRAILCEP